MKVQQLLSFINKYRTIFILGALLWVVFIFSGYKFIEAMENQGDTTATDEPLPTDETDTTNTDVIAVNGDGTVVTSTDPNQPSNELFDENPDTTSNNTGSTPAPVSSSNQEEANTIDVVVPSPSAPIQVSPDRDLTPSYRKTNKHIKKYSLTSPANKNVVLPKEISTHYQEQPNFIVNVNNNLPNHQPYYQPSLLRGLYTVEPPFNFEFRRNINSYNEPIITEPQPYQAPLIL